MACRLVGANPLSEPTLVCLVIGPIGTNFSKILIEIQTFSLKKMYLKMSSGKWWPFCLGLNMIRGHHSTWLMRSTNDANNYLTPVVSVVLNNDVDDDFDERHEHLKAFHLNISDRFLFS